MLIDVETVGQELGGVSTSTVWRLIRTGQLDTVRVGRRVMVERATVAEFIRRRSPAHAPVMGSAWTQDLPTAPGWYWVDVPQWAPYRVAIAYVDRTLRLSEPRRAEGPLWMSVASRDLVLPLATWLDDCPGVRWAGPLGPPEG